MKLPKNFTENNINIDSPRHKCLHCGNDGCADLIVSFTNTTEDKIAGVAAWDTWNIYYCPMCNDITIEQTSSFSEDYDYDQNGDMVYDKTISSIYPLSINNEYIKMTPNIPEEMIKDFEEARNVSKISPRSAAALLRLLLEKLCKKYISENNEGCPNKLNDMIKFLVNDGLPQSIQKACDIVRITVNGTVHPNPGTINIEEKEETVYLLFMLINMIADYLNIKYKKIEKMYADLPLTKRTAIHNRDK